MTKKVLGKGEPRLWSLKGFCYRIDLVFLLQGASDAEHPPALGELLRY